ncbi:FliM/FliN family flagellar motor switch protein [Vibrio sp. FNV 38]|nr:FliM/FliN family flagellar motor switch protein [Vibrio sp. FNV 38]
MKSNKTHIKKEIEQNDVFNIDPRTLGRPLNIAKANLTPKVKAIESTLSMAINSMTKRCDAQVTLNEICIDMTSPTSLHSSISYFSHSTHDGNCSVEISVALLTQLAEAFYGGKADFSKGDISAESQHLNASEKRVQTRLGAIALKELDPHWTLKAKSTAIEGCCMNAQFEISIGERKGQFNLALDDGLLIALGEPGKSSSLTPEEINQKRNHQLRQVPVRLNAVLAQQNMSLDQVAQLRVGDIIATDIKEMVEVSSGQQKLFLAQVSEQKNHLVLHITDHINQAENFSS